MKEKSFCDKPDFKTGYSSNSGNHVEEKHEGVKYYCDNCDIQIGNLSYLKVHKQVKHESRVYSCEKCNCKTKWRADFRKHVKNKHEILFPREGNREPMLRTIKLQMMKEMTPLRLIMRVKTSKMIPKKCILMKVMRKPK